MRDRKFNGWAEILVVMCIIISGCSSSDRSPLGKVTGTVTYNGVPVEEATIVFHNPDGRPGTGQIVEGQIENVTTYDKLNDGAAVGTLKVTIHPVIDQESLKPMKPGEVMKLPLPARYSDPQQSGLTAEIEPGTNDLTFELTD